VQVSTPKRGRPPPAGRTRRPGLPAISTVDQTPVHGSFLGAAPAPDGLNLDNPILLPHSEVDGERQDNQDPCRGRARFASVWRGPAPEGVDLGPPPRRRRLGSLPQSTAAPAVVAAAGSRARGMSFAAQPLPDLRQGRPPGSSMNRLCSPCRGTVKGVQQFFVDGVRQEMPHRPADSYAEFHLIV